MSEIIKFFNNGIFFYENGQVRSGRLNGDQTIQEVDFKDGDFVVFDEEGVLEK